MRIVDPYYFTTTVIIVFGISFLTYMKYGLVAPQIYQVAVIGSKVDSILLAYRLAKLSEPFLNITIIGKFDEELLSYADSTIQNDKLNMASLYSPYIQRKILSFCGTEPLLMELLQDSLLQYKIKRSQTLFNKGLAKITEQQFVSETYSINKQGNMLNSMLDYGLSHVTAKSILNKFQTHLQNGIEVNQNNIKSIRNILNEIMPFSEKSASNGATYMSQIIGLDQKYIRDYIGPLISSSYFHNVNSIATFFKILPLYCQNLQTKSRTKNLVLLLDEKVLAAKLLIKLHEYKNVYLKNVDITNLTQIEQQKKIQMKLSLVNGTQQELKANLIINMEDFVEENQKQISYYRAIVDGFIPHDDQYQEVYSVHFQSPPILSITRLCSVDCKNFKHNVYLVVSKSKISEKDLSMFAEHQIVGSRKMWGARSQFPSYSAKIEQRQSYFRISDTELISDNYEMKLIIFKNIANLIKKKMYEKKQ